MNTKNLSSLQIHQLSEAQYKRIVESEQYDENALYLTPDADEIYIINIELNGDTDLYYIPNFNWAEIRSAIEQNKTIICQKIYENDEGVFSRWIYLPLDIDATANILSFYQFSDLDTGLISYLNLSEDGTVIEESFNYARTNYVDYKAPYVIEVEEYDQIDFDEIRVTVNLKINHNIPVLLRVHENNITDTDYVLIYSDFTTDTHQVESCNFARPVYDTNGVRFEFVKMDFTAKTVTHQRSLLASTDYVDTAVEGMITEDTLEQKLAALVDSAPETLNTLNELANALGDDPNFATTVANQIGILENKVAEHDTLFNNIEAALEVVIQNQENYIGIISFTIATNTETYQCKADKGMTWGEWVNSDYNTYGFYIESRYNPGVDWDEDCIHAPDGTPLKGTMNDWSYGVLIPEYYGIEDYDMYYCMAE